MKQLTLYGSLILLLSACTSTQKNTNTPDASLTETYWKLTELMGKPVSTAAGQKEAHLVVRKENTRVNGNGSCNSFSGSYELKEQGRIRFSQVASTKMACLDGGRMETETEFFRILEMADSYYIKGDTLQLIKARMAPLAKFQAVYLK